MFNNFRLAMVALVLAGVGITGCSGKDDEVGKLADLQGFEHLTYIPADTTYAYLTLEPLDEDVLDMMAGPYEEMLAAYSDLMRAVVSDSKEHDAVTHNNLLRALALEFKDGVSLETFKDLGFDGKATGAFYGHGVLPVLRIRMADTDKFRKFIKRIEKQAEESLPTLTVPDMKVWYLDQETVRFAFGVSDADLVVTAMPAAVSQEVLEQLLGVKKPTESLASTTLINDLIKSKSYLAQGLGFVDSHQILNRLITTPQGVDLALAQQFELDNMADEISVECTRELRMLADTVPRLLFGLTRFDTESIRAEMLVEVQPDLAAQMSKFTAPVPGLGQPAGLFSLGMSFDLGEMQKFAMQRIRTLQKSPFKCEFLQIDAAELDGAMAAISNPATGMARTLQGFNLVIDNIDKDAVTKLIRDGGVENPDPMQMLDFFQKNVGVHTVVAAQSTEAIVALASMMMPDIAALELKPNGPPVSMTNFLPLPIPVEILVAMSDEAFAFAIGKDAEGSLQSVLKQSSAKRPPLLSYSIDGRQYMELLNAVLESPEVTAAINKDGDVEMSAEQMRRLIRAFYGVNGDAMFNIRMREDGIAMEQMFTFP